MFIDDCKGAYKMASFDSEAVHLLCFLNHTCLYFACLYFAQKIKAFNASVIPAHAHVTFFRSASLQHVNNMLREQLEQATSANQQLTLDIQKLTADWNKAREELEARDEEEQAYFSNEHVRLMDMWKTMNNFRRQFNEMKSATQRFVQATVVHLVLHTEGKTSFSG